MAKNKLGAWQLWFHYVLLEIIILIFISQFTTFDFSTKILTLAIFYLVISLGDQAIHWILRETTGWKD